MNLKKKLRLAVASLAVLALVPAHAVAHKLMLPKQAPSKPWPTELEDHQGGAASVQMALNACPTVADREYLELGTIQTSINGFNRLSEPKPGWFSDPSGIRGALEDPAFKSCGYWLDKSGTNNLQVLGDVLYNMNQYQYLTPVSIGTGEHWVVVYGFETDVAPTPATPTSANKIDPSKTTIYYFDPIGSLDPKAKIQAHGMVTGKAWLRAGAGYWGDPLSKKDDNGNRSAWDGHYLAVVEPPKTKSFEFSAPVWIHDRQLLEADTIAGAFWEWLGAEREAAAAALADGGGGLGRGLFELLEKAEPAESGMPLLVDAGEYSYYLVPFKDPRLTAVFNAYDGSFEELRSFPEQRSAMLDSWHAAQAFEGVLAEMPSLDSSELKLVHRPELGTAGRAAPVWELEAQITGSERPVRLHLGVRGEVLTDLGSLGRQEPSWQEPSPGFIGGTVGELRAMLAYDSHRVYGEHFLLHPEEVALIVSGDEALERFAAAGYRQGEGEPGQVDRVLEFLNTPEAFAVLLPEREEGGMLYVPIPQEQLVDESCPAAFFLPLRFAGGVAERPRECKRGEFPSPNVQTCRCLLYRTDTCDTKCVACASAGHVDVPPVRDIVLEQCGFVEFCNPDIFLDATPVTELAPGMRL